MRLTVNQAALEIQKQFGGDLQPDWRMRRVLDALDDANLISIERTVNYRTITSEEIPIVAAELKRRGLIPDLSLAAS